SENEGARGNLPLKPVAVASSRAAPWRLVDADDEERDRDVMAGDRGDGQCVEELVIAEHRRQWIGAAPHVDEGAGGVGQSSNDDQDHRSWVQTCDQLRQRYDGDPTKRDP